MLAKVLSFGVKKRKLLIKLSKLIEINRDLLNFLRNNGFKLNQTDLTEMYYDFKCERAKPESKHEEVLRGIEKKYNVGHTKAWEVIKIMDKDV